MLEQVTLSDFVCQVQEKIENRFLKAAQFEWARILESVRPSVSTGQLDNVGWIGITGVSVSKLNVRHVCLTMQ